MKPLTIIDAMDSPELFEPWFRGPSWDGWRAVLKAAFALEMTADEIAFFRSIAGGRDPPSRPVREMWAICGRGAGKDSIASLIIAFNSMLFDRRSSTLRPGERALVACIAVDREQAQIIKGYVRSFFHDCQPLREMVENDTADGLRLTNGVDVSILTNSYRSTRGRSMLGCVLDECAFYRDENSVSPDEETYKAVRPSLARVPGSVLLGITSPYKKSGLVFRKWEKHHGKDDDDVLVIQAASKLLNPTLDDEEIERDLQDDYAAARAEWFAEWRDDVAGWLPLEIIRAAIDTGVTVRPPLLNQRIIYRSGVDPSGGQKDSFCCAITHSEGAIEVLDCLTEIKAPFDPAVATRTIADVLKSYGLHSTTGDRYAAQWVISAFQKEGIRYVHSERDRSQIYLDCLPLFTAGRVRLLDNARLTTQFAQLERRTSSLGKDRVDHPSAGMDDCSNAAALALITKRKAAFRPTQRMIELAGQPAPYSRYRLGERYDNRPRRNGIPVEKM
jgi:hypothetical protein